MTDEKQADQSLSYLAGFAKMVKKQLKKAYNKDVRRVGSKMDLHDQPKAILKIGGKDGFELWFRKSSDDAIVIDKISDGKAAGTLKINTPVCHLRTSALLVDKFDIPNRPDANGAITPADRTEGVSDWSIKEGAVKQALMEIADAIAELTGEEVERLEDFLLNDPLAFYEEYKDRLSDELRQKLSLLTRGIKEEEDKQDLLDEPEEPEDFEEEFIAPSNKFAIVDASLIEGLDDELAQQAIIVPTKHHGAVFDVIGTYDDTILRSLTIKPSEYDDGGVDVVKTTKYAVKEGVAPLSHDSTPERKIRKHTSIKQKHHMKHAKDVPLRVKDVGRQVQVKRDKSEKDRRRKERQAESLESKKNMIQILLEDDSRADTMSIEELKFANAVMDKLSLRGFMPEQVMAAKVSIEGAIKERRDVEAQELLGFVEWIQKNPIKSQIKINT